MGEPELAIGLESDSDVAIAEAEASVSAAHRPVGTRRLFSNAVVFIGTAALQRAVAFLMLPIVTSALGPSQYGQLSVAASAMLLASILFGLGFDYAVTRLYLAKDADPERQEQVLLSTWITVGAVGFLGSIAFSVTAWLLLTPDSFLTGPQATLAFVAAAIAASTLVPLSVLRAAGRVFSFAIINLTNALASAVLIIVFVVPLHWGTIGFLSATVGASALGLVVAAFVVPLPRIRRPNPEVVRSALKLGVPLVPHFMSHWGLQLADRVVLATMVTQAQVGIYGLAGNFGLVAMIAVMGLNQAVMPTYARAAHDPRERARITHLAVLQIVGVLLICLTIALFGPIAVHLLVPSDFSGAAGLIPWITLGFGFLGVYFIPMNEVSLSVGQTSFVWVGTFTAAAVDILALFVFVPSGGVMAAAIASAVAYAVLLVWILFYRHRHRIVRHDLGAVVRAVLAFGIVYAGCVITTGSSTPVDILARAGWVLLLGPVLFLVGVVRLSDLRRALGNGLGSAPGRATS